jgi:hypothetical protein
MGLEAVDFPTDQYNYTASLRKELTMLYGRAQYSRECLEAIRATLSFYMKKLRDAETELHAYMKREEKKAADLHEANVALTPAAQETAPAAVEAVPEATKPAVKLKPT